MSDPTDVNQSQSDAADDDTGTRRSRRAMRQAERAAEREAILTGQQPLLTRRELKRLRQEAAALRAAVASGEITPEQAKALQDPLAEQPAIASPSLEATGSHAASSGSRAVEVNELVVSAASASSAPRAESPLDAAPGRRALGSPASAPSFDEAEAARALQSPERPQATGISEAGAWTPPVRDGEAAPGGLEGGASAYPGSGNRLADEPAVPSAQSAPTSPTLPREAESADDSWRSRPYAPESPMQTASPSAPGPATGSVFGREVPSGDQGGSAAPFTPVAPDGTGAAPDDSFADPVPQVANTSLSDDDIEDISSQPTGVMRPVDVSSPSSHPSAPPMGEPAVLPERRSLFNRDVPPADATDAGTQSTAGDGYGAGGPAQVPQVSDGFSDGVSEGVSEGFGPGGPSPASPGGDGYESGGPGQVAAGGDGYAMPDSAPDSPGAGSLPDWATDTTVGGPARRPTVRIPNAAQGVRTVDSNTGELSEVRPVDDEFDGIDNPQWRILRPEAGRPGAAPALTESEASAAAAEETTSSVPAFTPYEPMPEPAPEPQFSEPVMQAPPSPEAGWSNPAPMGSPVNPANVAEPPKTSKMGKILLMVLIAIVVVLVVITVVWFVLNRGGSSSAEGLGAIPTWTSLLD